MQLWGGRFDRWLGSGQRAIINEFVVIGSAILLVVAAMKLISAHPGPLSFLSDLEWEWYAITGALTAGGTAVVFDHRRITEPRPIPRAEDFARSDEFGRIGQALSTFDGRLDRTEASIAKVESEVLNLAFRAVAPSAERDGRSQLHDLTVEGELLLARCPQWTNEDPSEDIGRLFDEWLARIGDALPERPQIVEILRSPMAWDENQNELYRQIERAVEALNRLAPKTRRWDPDGNEIF